MLTKKGFWHKIVTQGHSRPFILQSLIGQQLTRGCRRRQPHSHLTPRPRGTPANIRIYVYFQKLVIGLCMSLLVWVYLHSNLCSGFQKTHLFRNRVGFGRSRSSKVDDSGTYRKCICDFLFVPHCDYGLILHRF